MPETRWPAKLSQQAGLALLYFLAAQVGFRLAPLHPVVASVWPPAGLALGALILGGLRLWPGVLLGALAANASKGLPVPAMAVISVGNTCAALAAAFTLRRLDFRTSLPRICDVLLLLGVGALCAPVISASIGVLSLHFGAQIPGEELHRLWVNWWSGDSIGVMLVAPLVIVWSNPRAWSLTFREVAEASLLLITLLVLSSLVLGSDHDLKYALFPLAGWAAVRYDVRGASVAPMLVAAVAVWFAGRETGPFLGAGNDGLWRLQLFLSLLTISSLVTATMGTALRTSELRFRRIFENAAVGIAVVQPDGRIVEANPALHRMLGFPAAELTSRTIADITHPDDWAAEKTVIGKLLLGESVPYRVDKRYLRRDGTLFWGKLTATHIPLDGNGTGSAMKLIEDISEQRDAREALVREQEELRRTTHLLQTLIDAAPLAILSVDRQGLVRSWNAAAEQIFGWSEAEALGQPVPFVAPDALPAFQASLDRLLAGEPLAGHLVRRQRRDGIQLDLRISAAPTRAQDGTSDGIIAIVEDVTERKRMGEQLKQAQKMEAIGELTGGIAHDFNNILTIILTNAALLADQLSREHTELRAEVADLNRAALRGAELVRKLMTFSRRRDLELSPIDLAGVVQDTERSLRRLLPGSVEVTTQIEDGVEARINGDAGAIEQIVFNLATNARDAMPNGGKLRLTLYGAWLDREHRRSHGWGKAGEYVVLAVSDTGCGMSPETRSRIFEPFFTTKPPGKGTGLGMAMVYGLMKQHNGYIGLYSELGHGTTFRLYFPVLRGTADTTAAREDKDTPPRGTERVLVVDDEEGLRRSAARVLRKAGYTVEEASDGERALELLTAAGPGFDLVLSDVVMPRLGGTALYQRLREEGNRAPVLLMSGYSTEDLRATSSGQPGLKFLHKPWTVTDLLRRVRGILNEAAEAGSGRSP